MNLSIFQSQGPKAQGSATLGKELTLRKDWIELISKTNHSWALGKIYIGMVRVRPIDYISLQLHYSPGLISSGTRLALRPGTVQTRHGPCRVVLTGPKEAAQHSPTSRTEPGPARSYSSRVGPQHGSEQCRTRRPADCPARFTPLLLLSLFEGYSFSTVYFCIHFMDKKNNIEIV